MAFHLYGLHIQESVIMNTAALVLLILISSTSTPYATWSWETQDIRTNFSASYIVRVYNPTAENIMIDYFGIHYPWSGPNEFSVVQDSFVIDAENYKDVTIMIDIPESAKLEKTEDFAGFFYYHSNTFDVTGSELFRSPMVEIKRGVTLYSEQKLDSIGTSALLVFFVVFCTLIYSYRDIINTKMKLHNIHVPVALFILFSVLYVSSAYSNFYPYYSNSLPLQGVPLTGDEPHYTQTARAMLRGTISIDEVYIENMYRHTLSATGLLTYGKQILAHPLGQSALLVPGVAFGEYFLSSGVLGATIEVALISAAAIVLIYTFSLSITKSEALGAVVASTYGISTLIFSWSTQLFSEHLIGFAFLFCVYLLHTNRTIPAGFILGVIPLLKPHALIPVLATVVVFVYFSVKDKQNIKNFILTFMSSISIFVLYVALYTGPSIFFMMSNSFSDYGGAKTSLYGLLGTLIDSSYGVLFYSPVILLAFIGVRDFYLKADRKLVFMFGAIFFSWYIPMSVTPIWTGWLALPGRYMMVLLPLTSILFSYAILRIKDSTVAILAYVSLTSFGLIFNYYIAFNRLLGYVILFVNNVGRSRILYALSTAYDIDVANFPDYFTRNVIYESINTIWVVSFILLVVTLVFLGSKTREMKHDGSTFYDTTDNTDIQ